MLAEESTRPSFPQHRRIHTLRKVLLHDQMSLCKRSIPDHCVNIVNTHTDITFKRCGTFQSGAGYVNTIVDFFFRVNIEIKGCGLVNLKLLTSICHEFKIYVTNIIQTIS